MLLIGVSAIGYGAAAGVWIVLRAVGEGIDRVAQTTPQRQQISIRLGFLIGRLFALALTVILVRKASGQDAALTALLVIVFAYTINLFLSFVTRPRSK